MNEIKRGWVVGEDCVGRSPHPAGTWWRDRLSKTPRRLSADSFIGSANEYWTGCPQCDRSDPHEMNAQRNGCRLQSGSRVRVVEESGYVVNLPSTGNLAFRADEIDDHVVEIKLNVEVPDPAGVAIKFSKMVEEERKARLRMNEISHASRQEFRRRLHKEISRRAECTVARKAWESPSAEERRVEAIMWEQAEYAQVRGECREWAAALWETTHSWDDTTR